MYAVNPFVSILTLLRSFIAQHSPELKELLWNILEQIAKMVLAEAKSKILN